MADSPKNVFINEKSGDYEFKNEDCMFVDNCNRFAEDVGQLELFKVRYVPDRYYFTVETVGSIKPADIVRKAFAILRRKLSDVKENIGNTSVYGKIS